MRDNRTKAPLSSVSVFLHEIVARLRREGTLLREAPGRSLGPPFRAALVRREGTILDEAPRVFQGVE
jgi:hypothetical protein